jgi:phosphate transport system substrate-binding protein
MRALFSNLAFAVFVAFSLMAANGAAAQTLRLGGTGTAAEMLRQVGAKFTVATGVKVDVIPSLGSTGAIRALADGLLDIAVPARPLKADESAAGLSEVATLRTPYVLATSHHGLNELKTADLPKIFAAERATWIDGTAIRIILRPRSETDTALLGKLFAGMDQAIEAARRRPEVPTAATDQDNADLAERVPDSLTGTTLTQLKTEHRNLRVVPLDGVEPTLANFESGAYPFAKKLHFILRPNSASDAQRFVDFLRSPEGEKALRETGTLQGTD